MILHDNTILNNTYYIFSIILIIEENMIGKYWKLGNLIN